jgi:MFS family permease
VQLARQMLTPIFTLFAAEKLGAGDIAIGILYAATGLMIFITAPFWGKFFDKIIHDQRKIAYIIGGLLLVCASLQGLQAYVTTILGTLILRLSWGVCLGALLPVLVQLLVKNIDEAKRGLFLGFSNSATKFGNLGGILLGALIEIYFGFTNSFLATAGLYFISGIIVFICLKPKSIQNS